MFTSLLLVESVLAYAYAASLPITLTGSWVILAAGIAVWVLQAGFKAKDAKAKDLLAVFTYPFAKPLLIFALVVFVSGLLNGGISEAWNSFWSLRALLVYFWGYHIFSTRRNLVFGCLNVVLSIAALSGIWSAFQQLTGYHPFGYQWLQGTGFLSGPMAYAGQMQMFSLIALGFALGKVFREKRDALYSYLLAFCNCVGVLFAAERSAWLGFIAGLAALASLKSFRVLVKSALVLAVIGALSFAFVPVVKQRLQPLANWQQDVSARVRVEIWQKSIEVFKTHPVFGVGIFNFPRFDIPEAIVPGRSKDLNHAHSNYFQMLTCLGIFGLAAYAFIWIWILWRIFESYKFFSRGDTASSGDERALLLGLFASTIALLVSGLFEYNFGTAQVRLVQWFLLSMYVRTSGK